MKILLSAKGSTKGRRVRSDKKRRTFIGSKFKWTINKNSKRYGIK